MHHAKGVSLNSTIDMNSAQNTKRGLEVVFKTSFIYNLLTKDALKLQRIPN